MRFTASNGSTIIAIILLLHYEAISCLLLLYLPLNVEFSVGHWIKPTLGIDCALINAKFCMKCGNTDEGWVDLDVSELNKRFC